MTKEILSPKKPIAETPLMKQYNEIKATYPDAVLLFRVGDFYETFGEDAVKASAILGIVLTRRANGSASYVELAGFPHHSLDTYLPKLVRQGLRVAICDQLEDPKLTKTIVKRGVTELVTPGVSYNDKVLDHKANNFLACIHLDGKQAGVSFLDISTGEFYLAQGSLGYVDKLVQSLSPNELILQKNKKDIYVSEFGQNCPTYCFDDWVFTQDFTTNLLCTHFNTNTLKGFGVEKLTLGLIAAGAALHYLSETQHHHKQHITKITRIEEDKHVWLDRFTIRNLEMVDSGNEQAITLLHVMDKTISPMGARLLRRWICLPLRDKQPIEERLDIVQELMNEPEVRGIFSQHIAAIGDLERLISKVAVGRINPREVNQLKKALFSIEPIKTICISSPNTALGSIGEQLDACIAIRQKIAAELNEDAPMQLIKGQVIASGVSVELDELRQLAYSGKDYLVKIQQEEVARTGITSLKIGFNNVFGYYLEVTNAHKDKVPTEWIRKQTLVNAERYITEELKIYEEKILGAEGKIEAIEARLFGALVNELMGYIVPIQKNAMLLAQLDCLHAFSALSIQNKYVRPTLYDDYVINITNGRHPVIERQLPLGEKYIANDIYLDKDTQQIIMVTGPNMSGKSALLRQTALIVLMAQMGCYVPADAAHIGLVDKVFTRVGASDNISLGESTFMVEMNETASILNNISDRSLILLDEIGRGTSTYDGISIAWAIAEYIHNHPTCRAKTLFATHYHELNDMAASFSRIKNYHVSIKELENKVVFLRKLLPGGTAHSFGIHVARMAGMPTAVLEIANGMLEKLEANHRGADTIKETKPQRSTKKSSDYQLSFIQLDDPLLVQIKADITALDINNLTPVEALMKLNAIKTLLKNYT